MFLQVSRTQHPSPPSLESNSSVCINVLNDHLSASYTGHVNQSQVAVSCTQCVRCSTPLYPNIQGSGIAYFEVVIKQKGLKGGFFVGVSDKTFQMTKILGSTRKSFSMRWDGKPFHNNSYTGNGAADISMNSNDVIGCGINFDKREIFYTYNGKYLGALFSGVEVRDYYPTICMSSFGEQITCVFLGPFVYDLEGMVRMENNRTLAEITQEVVSPDRLHELIHDYLFHEGYADTLIEFDRSAGISLPTISSLPPDDLPKRTSSLGRISELMEPILLSESNLCSICNDPSTSKVCENCLRMIVSRVEPSSPVKLPIASPPTSRKSSEVQFSIRMERCDSAELSTFYLKKDSLFDAANSQAEQPMDGLAEQSYDQVRVRGDLRRLICRGEIEESIRVINELFPGMLAEHPQALVALYVQQFIELIGQQQICEALLYARKHLTQFRRGKVQVRKVTDEWVDIPDVLGLLCYLSPETSPISYLLHQNQRELTADIVNITILGKNDVEKEGKDCGISKLETALQELVAGEQIYQKAVRKSKEDIVEIRL